MRIKHNDLTWYFIRPHDQLPASYLKSCNKFFQSLKPQAASNKRQAVPVFKPGKRVKNRFRRNI